MPYTELMKWFEFFKRRPIGWREDQRAYLLLCAQGNKEKAENIFPSLKALRENIPDDIKALPKGKFLDMMLKATNESDSDWHPPWLKGASNDQSNKHESS
jgi:hypothetical protein